MDSRKSYHGYRFAEDDGGKSSREEMRHKRPRTAGGYLRDFEFPFEKHRHSLNKMFFGPKDPVAAATKEHKDFWNFLQRYQMMKQKSVAFKGGTGAANKEPETSVEEWEDIDSLMLKGSVFVDEDDRSPEVLTKSRVSQFKTIVLLYLDFLKLQKQKALNKLREQQANLPIAQFKESILEAVNDHSVILIAGDTGCGKSTQVPQYLMQSGYEKIACTQPRRIACIALSKRVAYETQNELANEIGYQIRFEKNKTKATRILFLTEGLLLRQVTSDPLLSCYNVIIIDEVHERHLTCDFLLGVLKCLLMKRKDLKVILMSATINTELFGSYFGGCPIIEVPGRIHPIELKYQPIPSVEFNPRKSARINPDPYLKVLHLVDDKYSEGRGDMLVFLSGLTEITTVADFLREYANQTKKWIILILHSTLSIEEQDKVFDIAPDGVRKCILSTNIAETSVTIDGIRFVVDSGRVKEMSYDPTCRMRRLQEFWISQASAEQRKGRAGRTGPGVCFRLYSQKDFDALEVYSTPEIRRVPLDSLLLQMIAMGLPDARKFPFLEPPTISSIEEALQSLKENDAVTDEELLTPMGKMLSRLPVDITIGKMLILGSVFNTIEPMLSLAAALSVPSPLVNRAYRDPEMIAARRHIESSHGDPFLLLNAYNKWLEIKAEQREDSRKWCKRRGFEEQRFYEITKLRQQFKDVMKDAGIFYSHLEHDMEARTLSSSQRIRRHGEVKQLRALKREHNQLMPRKRKMLKLRFDEQLSDNEEEDTLDMKDVDFRLRHNANQVEALRNASKACSHKDVALLKVILTSGLHPQIAIPDEHNNYMMDSDQLFHTKSKHFVLQHPNGAFAADPELLRLRSSERAKDFFGSGILSRDHELIVYVSLLETTKPYLCNTLRVPSAHSLLLTSHSLDSNQDFTRIVCDSWLELQFSSADSAQNFVSEAFFVRDLWEKLLKKVFEEHFENEEDQAAERSLDLIKMQKELTQSVMRFLNKSILHTVKRLLDADRKQLYLGPNDSGNHKLPRVFDSGGPAEASRVHPVKGGLVVKSYFTYSCLSGEDLSKAKYIKKLYTCDICSETMVATALEQVRHQELCMVESNREETENREEDQHQDRAGTSAYQLKKYDCPICSETLFLTTKDILKHNLNHK